ncbi:MAG TPA: DNA polymerase III subunit delta, partial [Actinobacteria bacterium]|nr:DNA polymerase III subunit delta [Actinomycetes bacterium]HEX21464.1 DNA polymerase III subunit delta [Actinomycetota bacterium]
EIINVCVTLPFMSRKRLVVVYDYDSLSTGDKNKLADYFADPAPETILILVQAGSDRFGKVIVNKRTRLFKDANKKGLAFEYKFSSNNITPYIKKAFQRRDKVITSDALNYLSETIAEDLWLLDSEIEKISLYNEAVKKIDLAGVKPIVCPSGEAEVFNLMGCVLKGEKQQALLMLDGLVANTAAGGQIFYNLERQLRLLLRVKGRASQGLSDKELMTKLKISSGRLYFLKKQARTLKSESIKNSLKLLAESDLKRKRSERQTSLILEELLVDMADNFRAR